MQLMMEDESSLEEVRQREQAIRQLESDILDVNQIFKELATMVHEQGEVVDSIEANIESAHIQVEEGVRQVSQAATYQVIMHKTILRITMFVSFRFSYHLLFSTKFLEQSAEEEIIPMHSPEYNSASIIPRVVPLVLTLLCLFL